MKITRVEALPLSIPYHIGEGRGGRIGAGSRLDFCLVRVETDAGLVGWGEAFSYHCRTAVVAAVRDMIAPLAVGLDALDRDALNAKIQKKLHIFGRMGIQCYALSGLDIALWDLAGKAAGKPLHALLGGSRAAKLPAYASLLRYAEPALVAQFASHARAQGFEAVKLHEVTEPAVAAARKALGANVPLMVDVNCEWNRPDALAAARSFAPHQLEWLEEPVFPPEDFAGLRDTGAQSGVAIASGENLCYATQFEAMLDAAALTYVQPSVTKVGGVSEFVKVTNLARARKARVAPHSPYFGPGAVATLHLIAALAPEARFELFYLWADATLYPGLFGKPEVAVPQAPGLGVDPDRDVLERYRA
ncbi:MAG: mandelate racemase/muconate lactonizing enzyme family protein [Betaproteobacteria bacterium]|nr:mandelate racemase/muconate lactonizing enzyme family protein [Betaproteobacteria bacterium]